MLASNHNGSVGDFDVLVVGADAYMVYSYGPMSLEKLTPDFLNSAGINATFTVPRQTKTTPPAIFDAVSSAANLDNLLRSQPVHSGGPMDPAALGKAANDEVVTSTNNATPSTSTVLPEDFVEAPALWRRGKRFYLTTGHCCCFCYQGSGMIVCVATQIVCAPPQQAGAIFRLTLHSVAIFSAAVAY
jgi:hypothetical protein